VVGKLCLSREKEEEECSVRNIKLSTSSKRASTPSTSERESAGATEGRKESLASRALDVVTVGSVGIPDSLPLIYIPPSLPTYLPIFSYLPTSTFLPTCLISARPIRREWAY
jgi:hypothetical protein